MSSIVPKVLMFPRVSLQIKKFTYVFPMINTQLVLARSMHCGKRSRSTGKVWIQRIKIFAAHKGAMLTGGLAI